MIGLRVSVVLGLAITSLSLAGCATPARTEAMVASSVVAPIAANASKKLRGNIAIGEVTGGSATNPMWVSKVGGAEFERALETSLRNFGFLSENRQAGGYRLIADLREVNQPIGGFDLTVTSTVEYQLIDRTSNASIYRETITAPHTAKMADAWDANERLRLGNEGSIRANIERLIQRLSSLNP